jgi:hypothetical protein
MEINISDLSYDSYALYLIESVSSDRIIDFNTSNGSGSIIRNAGKKERDSMVGPSKDIGFIVHIPSKNVYFFDRELLSHASAGYRIGLETFSNRVKDCICGYYDPISPAEVLDRNNISRIRISGVSSDVDMIRPDTMQSLIASFEKALLRPAPSDFSVITKGDASGIFRSRNKRAFEESFNYHH